MCDNKDKFCYVCSKYTINNYAIKINDEIITLFNYCFKVSARNLNSIYSPNIICKICLSNMRNHKSKNEQLKIKVPAQWRDPRNHPNDCFFCLTSIKGYTHQTRDKVSYNYGYSCTSPLLNAKRSPLVDNISNDALESTEEA